MLNYSYFYYIIHFQATKTRYLKSEYNNYGFCSHLEGETKTKQCSTKGFRIDRLLPVLTFLMSIKLINHKKNVKVCPFVVWTKVSQQRPNARYAQDSVLCGMRFTETDMPLVKGQLLSNTQGKFEMGKICLQQNRSFPGQNF